MTNSTQNGLAVVTGAAGGLGACFAQRLAERGLRLLLVDRRRKQLDQICDRITNEYGVDAEPCVTDLSDRDDIESLAHRLKQTTDLELLVNNAGFGMMEFFVEAGVDRHLDMIHVHVLAPVMLTRAALPGMIHRDRGAIINVSSMSAWSLSAGNVQYASTKNYLAVFSQALHQELRRTNVRVQALCPGFVRTGFHDADSMKSFDSRKIHDRFWMSTDDVVNHSLRRLSGNQVLVIPGLRNQILGRLMQMPLVQPLVQLVTRPQRVLKGNQEMNHPTMVPPGGRIAGGQ